MTREIVLSRKRFIALVAKKHGNACVHVDFDTLTEY